MKRQKTPAQYRGLRAVPPRRTSQPSPPRSQPMIPQEDSPFVADPYIEGRLDLNRYLINHPVATFYVRVSGDSMQPTIPPGSILVVDRAIQAASGDAVIARIGDELVVKWLRISKGAISLAPDNKKYQPIVITENMDFEVWGRVTHIIVSNPQKGGA